MGRGLTLHPGKSYLEASFRMINRTPVADLDALLLQRGGERQRELSGHLPAQHAVGHVARQEGFHALADRHATTGRISRRVSCYKNHAPGSMFAWNFQDDFLAGYDHGKQAGTMSVADHNVVPGKKFWTWGDSPAATGRTRLLTDSDGPYIELMVGAYSDNQPDYSWMRPTRRGVGRNTGIRSATSTA